METETCNVKYVTAWVLTEVLEKYPRERIEKIMERKLKRAGCKTFQTPIWKLKSLPKTEADSNHWEAWEVMIAGE